jgi:hypothetical protein
VFSFSNCLVENFASLSNVVNPSPKYFAAEEPSAFEFVDGDISFDSAASSEARMFEAGVGSTSADGRLVFFTPQELNPGALVLPRFAPGISDNNSMVVVKSVVRSEDASAQEYHLELERIGGILDTDVCLLTSSMFSFHDAQSICQWQIAKGLHYDFGFALPEVASAVMQEICVKLLDAARAKEMCSIRPSEDEDGQRRKTLELLCGRNVVRNVRQSDVESLWELTVEGKSKIQMTNVANAPRRVIDPRCGVPLADLTVIELHTHLLRAGWECHVKLRTTRSGKRKATATHDNDGAPILQDYKVGSAKIWWIRPTDVAFRFKYLLALAFADEHMQPVRHFATETYYACLLEGRPFVKRASKRKFNFVDGDDGVAKLRMRPTNKPAAAKQARPNKCRLARAKRLAKAKAKAVAVPKDLSNDSDSSKSNEGSDSSSSSSSSSRSSTSSSSSSGSKSSAEVPQPQQ